MKEIKLIDYNRDTTIYYDEYSIDFTTDNGLYHLRLVRLGKQFMYQVLTDSNDSNYDFECITMIDGVIENVDQSNYVYTSLDLDLCMIIFNDKKELVLRIMDNTDVENDFGTFIAMKSKSL